MAKYILNQTTAQLLLETGWWKQIKEADYLVGDHDALLPAMFIYLFVLSLKF